MFGQICDCGCHHSKNIKHTMPCCFTCSICDSKIKSVFYVAHFQKCTLECEERLKRLMEQYRKTD
jgi:hypothetical protein